MNEFDSKQEPFGHSPGPGDTATPVPTASGPDHTPSLSPEELRKRIRGARIALVVVGLFSAFWVTWETIKLNSQFNEYGISWSDLPMEILLLFALAYAFTASYFVLSFVAKTRPYGASLAGLILFICDILIAAVVEPATIISGILVKILIILALVKAIKAGREYHQVMREEEIEKAFS